jgi:hypothetical protein
MIYIPYSTNSYYGRTANKVFERETELKNLVITTIKQIWKTLATIKFRNLPYQLPLQNINSME